MELSKESKSIISTVAVITVIILAVVGFFVFEKRKPYKENSKIGFAMGSPVTVKTFGSDKNGVEEEVIENIKKLDTEVLSNKTSSSVIGRVNSGEEVALDETDFKMIKNCLDIYSETDGKAALTVGVLSALWDFDSGKNNVPEKSEIKAALEKTGDGFIAFNGSSIKVPDGIKIDLGSVGKGAACDTAAQILNNNKIENAVVAVGGSIYAKGYTTPEQKIRVGIRNPFGNENEYLGYISTDNAFVSTSGDYEKVFVKDGKTYHHLLDCTTGYPVENELTGVTVICDNGAKSDALSTACFVMGYGEKTLELLKENNAEAIFVFKDKSVKMSKAMTDDFTLTDESFTVSSYES